MREHEPEILPEDIRTRIHAILAENGVDGAHDHSPELSTLAASIEIDGGASARPAAQRRDATGIPFQTLDPSTSTDLDQAFALTRDGDAIVLHYAIADVGAFVPYGSPIESEAWRRGVTVYAPDGSRPLYPRALSAQRASLLPDGPRPAVLLTVAIDVDGDATLRLVERAMVQSRAKLAYETVRNDQLPAEAHELGARIRAAEDSRGAFRVDLPTQEVVTDPGSTHGYRLQFAPRFPSEDLNAAMSLAANLAVAKAFLERGFGLFRVMDDPDGNELASLRRMARSLDVEWARNETLRQVVPRLDNTNPRHVAFSVMARRAGGGAGYAVYEHTNAVAAQRPFHAAIAAPYAHATAPMRRLADRYVLDLLLAQHANNSDAVRSLGESFEKLAVVMDESERRAAVIERSVIDLIECATLAMQIGKTFEADVLEYGKGLAQVQLLEHAVVSRVRVPRERAVSPGDRLNLTLVAADLDTRRLQFISDRGD